MNRTVSGHKSHSWAWTRGLSLDAQCVPIGAKISPPCLLLTLSLTPPVPADVRARALLLLRGGRLLPAQPEL